MSGKMTPDRKRMRWARGALALAAALSLGALEAQRPFRQFPGVEYRMGDIPLPRDYLENAEWTFARLMFPPARSTATRAATWTGTWEFPCGPRIFPAPTAISPWPCAA